MDTKSSYILRGPELKLTNEFFGKIIYQALKKGGTKTAIVDAITDKVYSYDEILKSTTILAEYFKNIGLTENDTIAICSENNLNYCIPIISGFYLGSMVSPVCNDFSESELLHVLKLSKPKIIFCSGATLDKIIKVSLQLSYAKEIILLDNYFSNLADKLEDILEQFKTTINLNKFEITPLKANHNALIIFSSGTTGLSKGVLHSHESLQSSHEYNAHADYGNFSSNKIGMGLSPFYFGFGFIRLMSMLITNMKVVVMPKFKKHLFLHSIQKYKITNIYLTPALVIFLAESPLIDKFDLSSVQEIMSGAVGLSKNVTELALKRLNCNNIRQGYGLTETMAIAMLPAFSNRPGSVGKPVPGRQCKIIDPDTNDLLGPYQQGELCVKGPNLMKQYIDNPVATEEIIDNHGWLHTGDAAYYDQEGYLFIVDRYKELIKYKGFQVPPAEIEDLLLKHPQVVDCAVVGKPDKTVGELATAFIVKETNSKITAENLENYVAENISYQKRLHGGVIFIKEIPKNPTGKTLRRVLKQRLLLQHNKL